MVATTTKVCEDLPVVVVPAAAEGMREAGAVEARAEAAVVAEDEARVQEFEADEA